MITLSIFLQTANSSGIASFLPFILIMIVIYFFMIRPQINKQKAEEEFQNKLQKGNKVITIGGIHGKIVGIKESKIILEISEKTQIVIDRQSISREKSKQENKK
tara:strand:- start:2059 stop:2370 length:312 start_codon:yes stop_codon:yes gene_type:complete